MSFLPSARTLKRTLCLITLPLLLAACGPDEQERADQLAVERSGVSPAIYDKMVHDDALSISDVAALSRARVNDGVIIRYIRDHDTVYYLNPPDFEYLQHAGVSPSVVDYMAQTGRYGAGGPVLVPGIGIGIGVGGGGYHHHGWR